MKKTRRAGRPASTKEDLLRIKIAAFDEEYTKGFCKSFPVYVQLGKAVLTLPQCFPMLLQRKMSSSWMGGKAHGSILPLSPGLRSPRLAMFANLNRLQRLLTEIVRPLIFHAIYSELCCRRSIEHT